MFDVGFLELIVISVIALLVIGPDRLPHVAQQTGRWIGRAKRLMGQWSDEVNRQIDNEALRIELEKKTKASMGHESPLSDLSETLSEDLNALNRSISQSLSGSALGESSLGENRIGDKRLDEKTSKESRQLEIV